MTYLEFLSRVIDEGIAAAQHDYAKDERKRSGSIAGFETCRNKTPDELKLLMESASVATRDAYHNDDRKDYWWYRCYELEVEWVCNVVSAMLMNQKLPVIITPTCRGVMQAAKILGAAK
jgi:hypothetical protein